MADEAIHPCPEFGQCVAVPAKMYKLLAVTWVLVTAVLIAIGVYFAGRYDDHSRGEAGHPRIIERIERLEKLTEGLR